MAAMGRRGFMRLGLALGTLTGFSGTDALAWGEPASSLVALNLTEASRKMRAKEVTSVELTRAYLDRIKIYNPKLNAFITVMDEQAMEQARAMDAEAAAGRYRGLLHGLPIVLKDNIDTKGTRTTAGSEVFDDRVPTADAFVTMRLEQAGAVILGKANMHEFAMGHTSATTYWGPVRNPWALDRTPAGSSGGCAAAVISDLCLAAVGTDTGGSVRMPAAYCGMVGLKPTYGLVSIRGIIPLTYSLDHCGPMTKTTEDAALMLNTMAAYDKYDVASVGARHGRLCPDDEAAGDGAEVGCAAGSVLRQARPADRGGRGGGDRGAEGHDGGREGCDDAGDERVIRAVARRRDDGLSPAVAAAG